MHPSQEIVKYPKSDIKLEGQPRFLLWRWRGHKYVAEGVCEPNRERAPIIKEPAVEVDLAESHHTLKDSIEIGIAIPYCDVAGQCLLMANWRSVRFWPGRDRGARWERTLARASGFGPSIRPLSTDGGLPLTEKRSFVDDGGGQKCPYGHRRWRHRSKRLCQLHEAGRRIGRPTPDSCGLQSITMGT
jgi:hypothetical protein